MQDGNRAAKPSSPRTPGAVYGDSLDVGSPMAAGSGERHSQGLSTPGAQGGTPGMAWSGSRLEASGAGLPDAVSNPSFGGTVVHGWGGTMTAMTVQSQTTQGGWTDVSEPAGSLHSPPAASGASPVPQEKPRTFEETIPANDASFRVPPSLGGDSMTSSMRRTRRFNRYEDKYRIVFMLERDAAGRVGIQFRGNRVVNVVDASSADLAGMEAEMRIVRIGDTLVHNNTSSAEVERLINSSGVSFEIEATTLTELEDCSAEHLKTYAFAGFDPNDQAHLAGTRFALSFRQAALSTFCLVFFFAPILVLALGVAAAGPLALILDWAYSKAFWLSCSIIISPLGGAPVLEDWTEPANMGSRIYVTILATWSVGILGSIQLLSAPAISTLCKWTAGLEETPDTAKGDEAEGGSAGLVRKMSTWRLRETRTFSGLPPVSEKEADAEGADPSPQAQPALRTSPLTADASPPTRAWPRRLSGARDSSDSGSEMNATMTTCGL